MKRAPRWMENLNNIDYAEYIIETPLNAKSIAKASLSIQIYAPYLRTFKIPLKISFFTFHSRNFLFSRILPPPLRLENGCFIGISSALASARKCRCTTYPNHTGIPIRHAQDEPWRANVNGRRLVATSGVEKIKRCKKECKSEKEKAEIMFFMRNLRLRCVKNSEWKVDV